MKKFPIICPPESKVLVTQGFNPVNNPSHDAIDFVLWNNKLSNKENYRLAYGSQFICPVLEAKVTNVNYFGSMNDKGNGIDIEWQEGEYWYQLHFWHTCKNLFKEGDIVKEGQVLALMGNTGFVKPIPTPMSPYDGTHCHLRFSRFKKNSWGGNYEIISLDPTLYFDVNNPYQGSDSGTDIDAEPLKWAWLKSGVLDNVDRLITLVKQIFI